jgi:hypothetical protein
MVNENKRKSLSLLTFQFQEASVDADCRKGEEDVTQTAQRPWLQSYLSCRESYKLLQHFESTTTSTNKSRFVAWITTSLSGYTNGLRSVETTKSLDQEA